MIEIEGVSRRFGSHEAVSRVTLRVARGESLAVLGPSGSGKTTLLRLIAGYERPDRGVIRMDGVDVTGAAPETRRAGMVFQNYALFPHMSAEENIGFGPRMRGVSEAEVRERVASLLELVGLPGFGARRPQSLSGGEQQRVALARALAIEPRVLLLDEPMANLDRPVRERLRADLRVWQQRLGVTMILVTHDQDDALTLATRLAVMRGGVLEQTGNPLELLLRPATPFVAAFLGAGR